jgi:N-acetylglucosamine kinase-like BadF-type ATPase
LSKSHKYLIGIDAGATSTQLIVCSDSDLVLFDKKFPPINYNISGESGTITLLIQIIKEAIKKAGTENIKCIVAGIAGARQIKDRNYIKKKLIQALKLKNIEILPDTEIALASVFDKNEKNCGILIAGTGSILYYRDGSGKINRIGGWGRFIGDEGSGYWIGKEALNRLAKYYDGIGSYSGVTNLLKKNYELDVHSLIKKIYHEDFDISKIAKHVFDYAGSGDKVSKDIIKKASEHLANHLSAFKMKKMKIALTGSLFTEELLLGKYFRKIVKKRFPNIKIIKADKKPVWGAVRIGLEKF